MWHEARKQERKIRGMLVDYRKRAERRRDFYEKIKADPTQFLQVHGRQSKIFLDPAIAAAADSATTMVPWQGHQDNLIDRFDVRAHLDFIPPLLKLVEEEPSLEDRQLNYERYRIVAQNSFLQIGEEKFLKQLHLEEQFGYTEQHEPKKKKSGGVAIGFNYDDGTGTSQPAPIQQIENNEDSENSDEGSDSDLDVDLSINVSKVDSVEAHEMNRHGRNFGMSTNDFYSFLTDDLEEAENFRLAKEEENEKALFAGRKSRRERRAHREKRLANRKISPPSYAAQVSPSANIREESESPTHSPSPEISEKITYITSFGGDDEPQMPLNPTYADKVKFGGNKFKKLRRDDSEERIILFEKKTSGCSNRYGSRRKSVGCRRRSRSYDRGRSQRTYHRKSKNHRKSRSSSNSSSSRSRSRARRSNSRTRSTRHRNRQRHSSSRSRSASSKSSGSSMSIKGGGRSRSRSTGAGNDDCTQIVVKTEEKHSVTHVQLKQEAIDPTPPVIPRYYGRRRSDHSSSSELGIGDENDDTKMDADDNPVSSPAIQRDLSSGNASTTAKMGSSGVGLSVQERLKRKRQALLNKQFKADKIAEQLKTEREKLEQQTRDEELREMGIKLRRRQRERRHAYESDNSSSSSSSSSRSSKSHTTTNNSNPTSQTDLSLNNRDKSRSKSPSSHHSSNHKGRVKDDLNARRSDSRSRSSRDKNRDDKQREAEQAKRRSKSPTRRSRDRDRNRRSRSRNRDAVNVRDRDRRDRDIRSSRLDRNNRERERSRNRSLRLRRLSRSRSHSWSRRDVGSSRREDRDRDCRGGGRSNARSLVDY